MQPEFRHHTPFDEFTGELYVLANWKRRAHSAFFDCGIPLAIIMLGSFTDRVLGEWSEQICFCLAVAFVVWNLIEGGRSGQTVGRRFTGVLLVSEWNAQPVGPARSSLRGVLHVVDVLPLLLGAFWPWWDRRRQTFSDKLMHTVVIHEEEKVHEHWDDVVGDGRMNTESNI